MAAGDKSYYVLSDGGRKERVCRPPMHLHAEIRVATYEMPVGGSPRPARHNTGEL